MAVFGVLCVCFGGLIKLFFTHNSNKRPSFSLITFISSSPVSYSFVF